MEVRIAHISDTHLGYTPREGVKPNVWGVEMKSRLLENDFYDRFAEVFGKIAKIDPPVDLVIHSGDFYDSPWDRNPSQPPVFAQEQAISVLKRFIEKTGIPVLIIEGNHGLYRSRDVSLLDLIRVSVPGVNVATQVDLKKAFNANKPLKFSYPSIDVFCFPFLELAVLESAGLTTRFDDWIMTQQEPSADRVAIAVAHGMELDKTLHPSIFSHSYDYIALGHDHKQHKHSKNAWYAGSIERWRFDEAEHQKGFLIVNITQGKPPKVEQHQLVFSRPVINTRFSVEGYSSSQSVAQDVRNWLDSHEFKTTWNSTTAARIRMVLHGKSTQIDKYKLNIELDALRSEILREGSEYNIAQFVWASEIEGFEDESDAFPEIISEYLIEDPESDFREFLETQTLPEDLDPALLTKIAVRALKFAVTRSGEHLTFDTLEEDVQ